MTMSKTEWLQMNSAEAYLNEYPTHPTQFEHGVLLGVHDKCTLLYCTNMNAQSMLTLDDLHWRPSTQNIRSIDNTLVNEPSSRCFQ
jgi:hypothetical protein